MTFITGVKEPKTVSVLVRGGTNHVADEVERSLVDAWSVVKVAIEDGMMVTGGGSTAMEIAMQLRDYAQTIGGREQIAIEAFASALESIPSTLAENAGLDPINIVIEMRKQHKEGKVYAGLNPYTGKVEDMKALNVIEPYRIRRHRRQGQPHAPGRRGRNAPRNGRVKTQSNKPRGSGPSLQVIERLRGATDD